MSAPIHRLYQSNPTWSEPTARLWSILVESGGGQQRPVEVAQAIADGADVEATNKIGMSALLLAIQAGPETAVQLLDAGARLRDRRGAPGEALKYVRRLLDTGAYARFLENYEGERLAKQESAALKELCPASAPKGPGKRM